MTHKKVLETLLRHRGIRGKVYWSKTYRSWMHDLTCPQRLGFNFVQAIEMITGGTMDFLKSTK